jgi:hypothetical protein
MMKKFLYRKALAFIYLTIIGLIVFTGEIKAQNAPTLPVDDIGNRVLKLVKDVGKTKDISAENIEKNTGIKVILSEENTETFGSSKGEAYGFRGKIENSMWFYNLSLSPEKEGEKLSELEFVLSHRSRANLDLGVVCINFESFRKELLESGFLENTNSGEDKILRSWDFSQNNVSVQIATQRERKLGGKQVCVSSLKLKINN